MKKRLKLWVLILLIINFMQVGIIYSQDENKERKTTDLDSVIKEAMSKWKIPGLSVVIVEKGKKDIIKTFGFADLKNKVEVTDATLFELASCSKAFTALAAIRLEKEKLLSLDDPVSKYLPWFYAKNKGKTMDISMRQFLLHTSGIPSDTISLIPQGNTPDMLEKTVRNLVGIELINQPGEKYNYASINYDVVGLIIEKVSGIPFEKYIEEKILNPLGLNESRVGFIKKDDPMAKGYKTGFFKPREYLAPVFRGNFPAGYVISNARDMAKWLNLLLGISSSDLSSLVRVSLEKDLQARQDSQTYSCYSKGWSISLNPGGIFSHQGYNPNFTSYIGFGQENQIGVVLLANSDSEVTAVLGKYIFRSLIDPNIEPFSFFPIRSIDKSCSVGAIIIFIYIISAIFYLMTIVVGVFRKKRKFIVSSTREILAFCGQILIMLPVLYGIYLIPQAVQNLTWESAITWLPISFPIFIFMMIGAIIVSLINSFLAIFFRHRHYHRGFATIVYHFPSLL